MKRAFSSIILGIACGTLLLSLGFITKAQNREKFVISATAGGVNAVSGRAERKASRADDWSLLTVTDDLKSGEVVKTGMDGRVEMLLNPGSYLRVGENSEFELTDSSLDKLEVRVLRGTAIIEATGADETELAINITTPHARMVIVKRGLYRVNVVPGDNTELFVRKGRVMLADTHTKVKEGNKVVFSSAAYSVAKLEKPKIAIDDLDSWSKDRAHTVAQANSKLRAKDLDKLMAGFDDYGWASTFSRSGFWLFNPAYRCYTFMPFGFGWGSPYGSSYSRVFGFGCSSCGLYGPAYSGYPREIFGQVGVRPGTNPGYTPGPTSNPGGSSSRPSNPGSSPDWPGRSIGKPDTNPDGGSRGRPMPKDN
ncbi:MAG TPA: FecR domain-containing protein [Pyrinomonadaceae bacterium]|nr:FecR domain-containing protein [Pyrinomonadaceae bacterium]